MLQLITIILMSILVGAEIDLYVPSFPELQSQFGLTPFLVELTLAVNLIAHCLASLVMGNLGDRYGRKPVILAGLVIFIAGSLFCLLADSYWHLLLGRFLQGIGVSAPAVLSFILVSDMYPLQRQQQLLGTMNGIVTIAMAVAPVVGSYVTLYFHWQGNFAVLLGLGLLSFVLTCIFAPTGKPNPAIQFSLREYGAVFKSSKAMAYIMTLAFLCLGYWMFIGMFPILYMDDLGVSINEFGYYQGSICVVFSLGSFISGTLIGRYGQHRMLKIGTYLLGLASTLILWFVINGVHAPALITLAMCIVGIGVLFPITIFYPLMLEAVPEAKSRISAIFTTIRLILLAGVIQVVSYSYTGSFGVIGIGLLASMVGTYICLQWLYRADTSLTLGLIPEEKSAERKAV